MKIMQLFIIIRRFRLLQDFEAMLAKRLLVSAHTDVYMVHIDIAPNTSCIADVTDPVPYTHEPDYTRLKG